MTAVELPDGRRLRAEYDWSEDRWTVQFDDPADGLAQGRWLHDVARQLFPITPGTVSPKWLIGAAYRLAEHETPLGPRVVCRCCAYLTLERYGHYDICPVCNWEDDPTTIFRPGEPGGPGPNHLSLTEGRRNFSEHGISKPTLAGKVRLREPHPDEHP
jgi:hypothetical protein